MDLRNAFAKIIFSDSSERRKPLANAILIAIKHIYINYIYKNYEILFDLYVSIP